MKKIAITGSNGYVGRHLVNYLRSFSFSINCLTTNPSLSVSSDAEHVQYFLVDYSRPQSILDALSDCDAVIHLASVAHINTFNKTISRSFEFIDCNLLLLQSVLAILKSTSVVHFIYLSSIGVYGDQMPLGIPQISESLPYNPCQPYSLSKVVCERLLVLYCESTGLRYTILQPPLVYSPDAPGNFSHIYRFLSISPILPFSGLKAPRSFLSVGNLCSAIHSCILNPFVYNDTFILSDGCDISLDELQLVLARHFRHKRYICLPLCFLLQPILPMIPVLRFYWLKLNSNICVSSNKFSARTGWVAPELPFSGF